VPKSTFYNLPDHKRTRIIDAALNEFAVHPLDAASVNRVVKAAGIAKGSFYQYFSGLNDLYLFILFQYGAERKAEALEHAPLPPADGDLFDSLSHYAFHRLRFSLAHPRLAAATRKLTRGPIPEAFSETSAELRRRSRQTIQVLLERGIAEGALRSNLELDTAVIFTEQTLHTILDEAVRHRFGVNFLMLPTASVEPTISDTELSDVVTHVIDLLRHAIGAGNTGA